MKRAALVIAGTVAGTAGVLSFPVQKAGLTVPATSDVQPATAASPAAAAATGSAATPAASPTPAASAARTATGSDVAFRYGDVAVRVTVASGKITAVQIASLDETDGRSVQIDSYAIPQLQQQVLAANSANIDGISGATFTSQAFVNSLSSALSKLGFTG
jgi:uncharacterized protein with FMN-binding domain